MYAHWNADKLLVPRHYSALPPPLSCFASLPSSQAFPAIHQQLRGGPNKNVHQKTAPLSNEIRLKHL